MASRIEGMMQIPSSGLWIGTFHGLANRLLKRHWVEAGLPQNFQILDSDDQLALIKRVNQGDGTRQRQVGAARDAVVHQPAER
jgi:DNA helicase-2/ATP-dependent DNA helicase PcrA